MYSDTLRPTWVEIDLSAFDSNIKEIRRHIGEEPEMIGVIKADGYGHGAVRLAGMLAENGVTKFAVATLSEAVTLREAGVEGMIIVLGIIPASLAGVIVDYDVTPAVSSCEFACAVAEEALRQGKTATGLLALDTGMCRIGFRLYTDELCDEAVRETARIASLDGLELVGMFSHFSDSEGETEDFTRMQLGRFNAFAEKLAAAGVEIPWKSIANSAAIVNYPEARFDCVRPGIIQYGIWPSEHVDHEALALKPVMSLKANMCLIKTIPAGSKVSYGCSWEAKRESRVATLSIGYADGYPRTMSGKAEVIVKGRRCPVIGRICMDQCVIDVTDVPDVSCDDEVTLIGRDGDEEILIDELAGWAGSIPNEICCLLTLRLPRVYVE